LASSDATEIEAQHRKVSVGEGIIELVYDLMVHRPPELGMRMKNDPDRGISLPGWMVPAFDATSRAGKYDLGHDYRPRLKLLRRGAKLARPAHNVA
jgi:hypothetical protein